MKMEVIIVLKNIKSRIAEAEIKELLSLSIIPDPEKLESLISHYTSNQEFKLYGYESEDEIVGIIGFKVEDQDLMIHHLAVKPSYRGLGFGRGQILEAIELVKPLRVIAETDEEAVDFYRWIGFEIESLGDKYPGVEHFKCTYHT